ncbi:MAG: hypothetical protein R3C58_11885 [Parvularculaceae bacterium]
MNAIAPWCVVVLAVFWNLWHSKTLNGATIHRFFFFFYSLHFAINFWHILARISFPKAFAATYYFSLAASNIVFVLMIVTVYFLAILKFLDNNAKGGLMGVYDRNIHKWRKWFGGDDKDDKDSKDDKSVEDRQPY